MVDGSLTAEPYERPLASRPLGRRIAAAVLLVVGGIVATIWDEAIFSTPVVLATKAFGAGTAAAAFFVVYGAGGALVSHRVGRSYDRRLGGGPGRLERWFAASEDSRRVRWVQRLLRSGSIVAFATSSVVLGPIATTLLVRSSQRDRGLWFVAVASSTVWAAAFVASYAGVAGYVLD